jgi:hypothetical protein
VVRAWLPPVGRAQHLFKTTLFDLPLRARRTGFYRRVGASRAIRLRPFCALPRPDVLSPLALTTRVKNPTTHLAA